MHLHPCISKGLSAVIHGGNPWRHVCYPHPNFATHPRIHGIVQVCVKIPLPLLIKRGISCRHGTAAAAASGTATRRYVRTWPRWPAVLCEFEGYCWAIKQFIQVRRDLLQSAAISMQNTVITRSLPLPIFRRALCCHRTSGVLSLPVRILRTVILSSSASILAYVPSYVHTPGLIPTGHHNFSPLPFCAQV